jgi:hypothetical protein
MKKLVAVFVLSVLLFSCDDGNLDVASFDFKDTNPQVCNSGVNGFFLFNIKDKRALILKIPESNFNNSLDNLSNTLEISSSNELFYREYVGAVATNNICGSPTSANLNLAKQWSAKGGTIKITTTLSKPDPGSDGSTNYNSVITLTNVVFDTGNGEQRNDVIDLGTYTRRNPNILSPNITSIFNRCSNNSYNSYFSNQALLLKVDPTIFDTTILDTPKTRPINGTTNTVVYNVYNIAVSNANFLCNPSNPPLATDPTIIESWVADNAVGANGQIEVTTTTVVGSNPVKYRHKIVFKGINLKNNNYQNFSFKLSTNFIYAPNYEP